jgi:hypothetical protein
VEVARVSKTENSVSGAFQRDSHDDFIFDMEEIVHQEYVPESQTVDQHKY